MSISRSESHNQNKKRRRKRLRRLLMINSALLALIAVFVIVYALSRNGGSRVPPPDGKQQQSADTGSGKQIANGSNGEAAGGGAAGGSGSNGGGKQGDGTTTQAGDPAKQPDGAGSGPSVPGTDGGAADEVGPVKLSFVGDILLAGKVDSIMRKQGDGFPFAKAKPYLQAADLTAGNLETPITTVSDPADNKQFVFKGRPDSLPSLKAAGFDVVTLANNHTLDHGTQGLLDTMANLDKAGVSHIGGGKNQDEAFKPHIALAKGVKVAYLGFSRVLPEGSWKAGPARIGVAESYDERRAVQAIKDAKGRADLVVVLVHWGIEKADWPVSHQKMLARAYIDAGADLVVGAHPHVLQGFEQYKGKWIAYSLGNFIFNMTPTKKTWDTGVLDATCDKTGKCSLQLHPMRAAQSQPAPLQGHEAAALLKRISGISIGARIDGEGRITANAK